MRNFPIRDDDWKGLNVRLDAMEQAMEKFTGMAVTSSGATVREELEDTVTPVTPVGPTPTPGKGAVIVSLTIEPSSAPSKKTDPNSCAPVTVVVSWEVQNSDLPMTMVNRHTHSEYVHAKWSIRELEGSKNHDCAHAQTFELTAKNQYGQASDTVEFTLTPYNATQNVIPPPTFGNGQGLSLSGPVYASGIWTMTLTLSWTGNDLCNTYQVEHYSSPDLVTWSSESGNPHTILGNTKSLTQVFDHVYKDHSPAQHYRARVRGHDWTGNQWSDWSTWASADAVTKTPNSPTLNPMVEKSGATWFKLEWAGPSTNTDGSPFTDLKEYECYCAKQPAFNPDADPPVLELKSYIGRNTSHWFEMASGEVWYGKVRAVNSSDVKSTFSSEVST